MVATEVLNHARREYGALLDYGRVELTVIASEAKVDPENMGIGVQTTLETPGEMRVVLTESLARSLLKDGCTPENVMQQAATDLAVAHGLSTAEAGRYTQDAWRETFDAKAVRALLDCIQRNGERNDIMGHARDVIASERKA